MSEKLFDFAAEIINSTDRAYLFSDGTQKFWLPKEVVQDNGDGTYTIPMWWAYEKELI